MKNTLLITTLLAAGTLGAMAERDLTDKLGATDDGRYEYGADSLLGNHSVKGSNPYSQVTNYAWNGTTINLGQDARWELTFTVNSTAAYGALPLINLYLAAPNNSIVYGNYYLNTGRGAAAVFHFAGDVSQSDTRVGSNSYILSDYLDSHQGGVVNVVDGSYKETVYAGGNLPSGIHRYSIIIESFADQSKNDLIMFTYDNWNDHSGESKSGVFAIDDSFGGINVNRELTVGCLVDECTADITLNNVTLTKATRSFVANPPPTPPTPTPPPAAPEVPEPSAFGLLAGAGALVLVAARRRRSRL